MKETYMKRQGYSYYVYICPGRIEYFFDLDKAEECAKEYDAEVHEMF